MGVSTIKRAVSSNRIEKGRCGILVSRRQLPASLAPRVSLPAIGSVISLLSLCIFTYRYTSDDVPGDRQLANFG